MTPQKFQQILFNWFDVHGRHHLPWQRSKTPYRVWISETMLQQTQVNTVIPYFERFMELFPDVSSLADANEDVVLHCWAGLGYYNRARNLQRAARIVVKKYNGQIPNTLAELVALPGIGPSTAGAILAIAFEQQATILDGNVKRVLARLHGITEPIDKKSVENELWMLARHYTPGKRIADYTQAIMDLGAMLCTRRHSHCDACPFRRKCIAYQQDIVDQLPKKLVKRALPEKTATFLLIKQGQFVLLHKRPPVGIWSGLWSVPEIESVPQKISIQEFCQLHFQLTVNNYQELQSFYHTFSHYRLNICPVLIHVNRRPHKLMDDNRQIWYNSETSKPIGLPKPVQTLLKMITAVE